VVVPASIGWDDVGDFDSLASLLADADGTRVLGDASLVRSVDSTGLVVPRSGRVVAVVGLEDIVVVDTADALLVTTRAHAQQVKQVVTGLQQDGRGDLT
jgi:mannose-1-phosphate guanylyltransferase